MKLRYFRIIKEESDDGRSVAFRIQRRGWFMWKDVRVLRMETIGHPMPLTKILRFDSLEKAESWINDQRARQESKKTVVATYAIYG